MEYDKFKKDLNTYSMYEDGLVGSQGVDELIDDIFYKKSDMVNNPPHYTRGGTEAIEIIADAINDAPTPYEGFLQGQVLKYLLRLWLKGNPSQDAEKAQWYLNKLVDVINRHD